WEGFESSIPIPAKENSFNEISFQLNERDLLKEWVDDEIRHAINRLPEKYRKAVIMFDLQGHTYQELAETFNCAIGTIKSRLFRGRTLLKRLLTKYARQKGMIPAGAMTN
ncbi:MAG: hypothetical protein GY855_11200, partial [candidate division Zixibacteria bacterium]|nr:hypothetical protein [candidate division Zixibacteria bacterium]